MTRSELIAKLAAKNPALYHRDIERLVSTILDEIGGALERGDRVELRGFGAFSVRQRKSRFTLTHRKGAKATKLNSVAAFKRTADFVKYGADQPFDVAVVKCWIFCRQFGDKL